MIEKEDLIELLATDTATESVGIYPASVHGKNGYKKRNRYQNGWNDAVLKITHNAATISKFLNSLPSQELEYIVTFLLSENLWLRVNKDQVKMLWNMNDTFAYSCADAEEMTIEDLPLVCKMVNSYGIDAGVRAWASWKRSEEVIPELDTVLYRAAKKELELEYE